MNELHVGRGITHGAMTVFPLWGDTGEYRRYTMGGRHLDVTEVEDGPDVGTLLVANEADRPALVLEGQLFEGGWQHRMSRHSLMVGVHQQVPVEVACVEAGRWGGTSENGFDCSGLVGYVFKTALGIDLPRVSRDMATSGERIERLRGHLQHLREGAGER